MWFYNQDELRLKIEILRHNITVFISSCLIIRFSSWAVRNGMFLLLKPTPPPKVPYISSDSFDRDADLMEHPKWAEDFDPDNSVQDFDIARLRFLQKATKDWNDEMKRENWEKEKKEDLSYKDWLQHQGKTLESEEGDQTLEELQWRAKAGAWGIAPEEVDSKTAAKMNAVDSNILKHNMVLELYDTGKAWNPNAKFDMNKIYEKSVNDTTKLRKKFVPNGTKLETPYWVGRSWEDQDLEFTLRAVRAIDEHDHFGRVDQDEIEEREVEQWHRDPKTGPWLTETNIEKEEAFWDDDWTPM